MGSTNEQKVQSLGIKEGEDVRLDCPFCGRKNTFSASMHNGRLMWNCFSVHCKAHGKSKTSFTAESASKYINNFMEKNTTSTEKEFEIPAYFKSVHSSPEAIKYLYENNCLDLINKIKLSVHFDPKQERVVFPVIRKGIIYDAIGRSLRNSVVPKWYRYNRSEYCFWIGNDKHSNEQVLIKDAQERTSSVVLVEDCASACSVGSIIDTMALLGTSLSASTILEIAQNYNTAIISLDRDASTTALKMYNTLRGYVNTKVILYEEEFKNLTSLECLRVLEKWHCTPI